MFCTVQLSKSDPTPLYIQLSNELAKLIHTSILPSGTKLPTIRSLSRKLGINRDTVVSAYRMLETQGLITSHVGSGTYVSTTTPSVNTTYPTNTFSCSNLNFPSDLFPPAMASMLAQPILEKNGWSSFIDPLYRERSLLKQSTSHFLKSVGISPSPAEIHITKDSMSTLLHLLRLSTKKGICIEEFTDLTYHAVFQNAGIKIHSIPLEEDGLDLVALEKALKQHAIGYIWVSSYIQNPTGISYSTTKKQAILKLARQYDCYIIEDGTLNDFVYNHFSLEPLYTLDTSSRVVFLYHFSKLYLPKLSYTFLVLPPALFRKVPDTLECTFNEYLLREYLDSDIFSSIRQRILEDSYSKYEILLSALSNLSSHFKIYNTKGGLFFWIECLSEDMIDVCNQLANQHLIVAPGTLFTNKTHCHFFRLSISSLKLQEVEQVIEILTHLC